MAWIDYNNYTELGYTTVPQTDFARLEGKAEATISYYTQGGLDGSTALTENQQRGLCELTEVLYLDSTGNLRAGPISGFSNGRYSESYAVAAAKGVDEMVLSIIDLYFHEELANARVLMSESEWAREKHDRQRL